MVNLELDTLSYAKPRSRYVELREHFDVIL